MADETVYRLAVDVPWDDGGPQDWSKRFDEARDVMREWRHRSEGDTGEGFRLRRRGDNDWGPVRDREDTYDRGRHILQNAEYGDVLIIQSIKTRVKWLIRKVHIAPPLVNTIGDEHVDWMYTEIFKSGDFSAAENWGIRNDRYIDGTRTPSAHWARKDSSSAPCEARAIDINGPSIDYMWSMARRLAVPVHTSKILFNYHEWLPSWGEFRYVGVFIGHRDHLHVESADVTGTLC